MFDKIFHLTVEVLIFIFECFGIAVITTEVIKSFYHWTMQLVGRKDEYQVGYCLAKGMATGLQFKMAAEILKTAIVSDMSEFLVLGAVVLLRTIMSLLIHLEMKNVSH